MKEIILLLAIISVPFLILRYWGKQVLKRDNRNKADYDKLYASIKTDIIFYTPDKSTELDAKFQILEKMSTDPGLKEKTDVLTDMFYLMLQTRDDTKDVELRKKIDSWGKKTFGDSSVNKREFANRSDVDETDFEFMSHM